MHFVATTGGAARMLGAASYHQKIHYLSNASTRRSPDTAEGVGLGKVGYKIADLERTLSQGVLQCRCSQLRT